VSQSDANRRAPLCTALGEFAAQVVEGGLPTPEADALRAHAAACGACATVLAHQTRLSRLLRSAPAAPPIDLVPPVLPRGVLLWPGRRRRLAATAAALAAAAVVAAVTLLPRTDTGHTDSGHTDSGHTDSGHTDSGHTDSGHTDSAPTGSHAAFVPVRVLHVEDMAERAPLPDDDLMALTSGLEAVALRRPAGYLAERR